ncbi:MAG: DUF5615 family PIN-like protein [Pyrinomonadaceae bacterium]
MKLLFDECVPRPLRSEFGGHEVATVEEAGFKSLKNGALLQAASKDFDVLVTVDKNIEYQQNPRELPIAILVVCARSNRLENLLSLVPQAASTRCSQ